MKTEFYTIAHTSEDDAVILRAGELIRCGGLVGFPTETVYGLGASALSADAAAKIYAAKGRPSDNPLIVHISHPEDAQTLAFVPPVYYELAKRFMPGPLTVIMPKRAIVPDGVTGGLSTVAIRCPAHPVARALIDAAGVPIAAPSANRSGSPSPTTAAHVQADMDGRIEMILDGGPAEIGLESTVIRLTEEGCEILRPGAVTEWMLAEVCHKVTVSPAVVDPAQAGDKPASPGMKYKHYAPQARVILVDGDMAAFAAYVRAHIVPGEAVAVSDDAASAFSPLPILSSGRSDTPEEHARTMFALLREADEKGYTAIYIPLPPPEGRTLALYNRLIRAAGGQIVRADIGCEEANGKKEKDR